MVLWPGTRVIQSAFTEWQQHSDVHILIHGALAGKAEFTDFPLAFKFGSFGFCHVLRLSCQEFHPSGCAAGKSSAAMQRFSPQIFQSIDQANSLVYFEFSNSFDDQFRHGILLTLLTSESAEN